MHNPLVIEAIMLIAAIIVGVWSQRALPLHADSRPILFLLCLFLGTGSALCLLLDILALLLTGQVATGGVRIYGPLLLLVVLWKPLNWVVGIIEDFVQRRAEKGRAKASTTAVNADRFPLRHARYRPARSRAIRSLSNDLPVMSLSFPF